MALLDFTPAAPRFSIRTRLAHIAYLFGRMERMPEPTETARRDFVLDVLRENGNAFRSESDIQCMMNVYPGRF